MNAFIIAASLVSATYCTGKALDSLLGSYLYRLDQQRSSRDSLLKRRKKFKWPQYIFLAVICWTIFFSRITTNQTTNSPLLDSSIQLNQISSHE
jgi:hypothetical protein